MKNLVIALILFAALLAATTANALFVRRTVTELSEMVRAMPEAPGDDAGQAALAVRDLWEAKHAVLSLTVADSEMDSVDERVSTLCVLAGSGDGTDYRLAREMLRIALDELGRLERFSRENIF